MLGRLPALRDTVRLRFPAAMFTRPKMRCWLPFLGWVGTKLGTVRKVRKSAGSQSSRNLLTGKKNSGAPGEIRTPDLLLRRQSLYPAELRARSIKLYTARTESLRRRHPVRSK